MEEMERENGRAQTFDSIEDDIMSACVHSKGMKSELII